MLGRVDYEPYRPRGSTIKSVSIHLPQDSALTFERLRPYQRDGVRFLLSQKAALLADEMGLGKTVQTAVALQAGRERFQRNLLVAPTPLCLNWQRELEAWAPGLSVRRVMGDGQDRAATYSLPVRVLIASYDQIRRDIHRLHGTERFDLVILDEAQRIKGPNSQTSLACRTLQRDRAWALTGTPLENEPEDLISIFRFLDPGLLRRGMSIGEIHNAMKGHFLRRTKVDVLQELPPILVRDLPLELGTLQRRAYDAVWQERWSYMPSREEPSTANMLAVLTRLKQLCNYDPLSQQSIKLEALDPLLQRLSEAREKFLLFSQYVETLRWLSSHITLPHDIYHGGQSGEERERVLADFRNRPGPRGLLVSLRAGGVGLNLQEASTVIIFDRWWNPAVENQAIHRAHRFGRQEPLQVVSRIGTRRAEWTSLPRCEKSTWTIWSLTRHKSETGTLRRSWTS